MHKNWKFKVHPENKKVAEGVNMIPCYFFHVMYIVESDRYWIFGDKHQDWLGIDIALVHIAIICLINCAD